MQPYTLHKARRIRHSPDDNKASDRRFAGGYMSQKLAWSPNAESTTYGQARRVSGESLAQRPTRLTTSLERDT